MVLNLEMDRALHQALTLNPSSSLAHFVRGIKYRETPLMFGGNYEKSLFYLQKAQDLGFEGIMLPLELAKTYIQLKRNGKKRKNKSPMLGKSILRTRTLKSRKHAPNRTMNLKSCFIFDFQKTYADFHKGLLFI